jgi:hypothetical protein
MKTMKSRLYSAFFAGVAVFTALVLAACTFALDPVNAINDMFRFADTNVGTLRVHNGAPKDGAVLYAIQVTYLVDNSRREYWFESGLLPGSSREYSFPVGDYKVKFNNGQGWTKNSIDVKIVKDTVTPVNFTGTEEISIDLAGVKGKLTVYNLIPAATTGEYVIENLRVSSSEGTPERDTVVFYFYTDGIRSGKDAKHEFDILPGEYWVRAQIRHPNGKLSKWSIPAYMGEIKSAGAEPTVSTAPAKVTVSATVGGIAIFNAGVLKDGAAGGDVNTGDSNFPSIPDNNSLDDNGNEIPNVGGNIGPDSSPVKAIKVEKLGFPTADKDGVTVDPKYVYDDKNEVLDALLKADNPAASESEKARVVRTTIYDQDISPGGAWQLSLSEPGWYLLSFSVDGKTFSKGYPIRLEDKNGNGKIDPDEVEPKPGDIPPFDDDNSTWIEKDGVVVTNNTPENGGDIIDKDGSKIGTLSQEDARKPITDIKIYNTDGTLYAHYRDRRGLPIYNGAEWIVNPTLNPGDYLVTFSDDYGKTWTYPPIPLHVDGNGNGSISYDKTHPQWDGTSAGKPAPETTSPGLWGNTDDEKNEIPRTPIYVVVPSDPPLDTVPPEGPKELVNATVDADGNDTTLSAYGSQLDIVNRSTRTPNPFVIKYIKLNASSTPRVAYRIIDLSKITYSGGGGGVPVGARLSLVGFDLKPDKYHVYLSEDGKDWKRYTQTVDIPAPWVEKDGGIVFTGEQGSTATVPKVIYRDSEEQIDWDNNPPPSVGILLIRNSSGSPITALTIKKADDTVLTHDGVTYNGQQTFSLANGASKLIELPVTGNAPYTVGVTGTIGGQAGSVVYYRVTIVKGNITYLSFKGTLPDEGGTETTPIPLDPDTDPDGGGGTPGDGGTSGPTGILVVRNFSGNPITGLTIKKADGSFLAHDGVTYNGQQTVNIPNGGNEYFTIPVPPESAPYYIAGIKGTLTGPTQTGQRYVYYQVSIKQGKITYLSFYGNELEDSSEEGKTENNPIPLDPDAYPGNGDLPGTPDPGTPAPGTPSPTGILVVRNNSTDQAVTKLVIKKADGSFLTHGGVTYNGNQTVNILQGGNEAFTIPVTAAGQAYTVTIEDTAGTPKGTVYYRVTILQNKATYLTFSGTELGNANGKGKTETDPIVLDPDSSPGNGVEPGTPSVDTGILVVRNNSTDQAITKLAIKKADGNFLTHDGVTYNDQYSADIPQGGTQIFTIPGTAGGQVYTVTIGDTAGTPTGTVYYRVTILRNRLTYLTFSGTELGNANGKGKTEDDPIALDPDNSPGNGDEPGTSDPGPGTDPDPGTPSNPPTPVETGILVVRNYSSADQAQSIAKLTIKKADGSFLTHGTATYDAQYAVNIPQGNTRAFTIPVTTGGEEYTVIIQDTMGTGRGPVYYKITILYNKLTYLTFYGNELENNGKGKTENDPIVLHPDNSPGNGVEPVNPDPTVDTGILVVRNYSTDQAITKLVIKKADGSFLTHGGVTYNGNQSLNITKDGDSKAFIIPVTPAEQPYRITIEDTAGSQTGLVYYRITIRQDKLTYLTFYGDELDVGKGKVEDDPIVLDPDAYPGNGGDDPGGPQPTDPGNEEQPGTGGGGSGNDGGGDGVKTGILIVQNPRVHRLVSITIKHPYSSNNVLVYAGQTYADYDLDVPAITAEPEGVKYQAFVLPVTTEDADLTTYNNHSNINLTNSYQVKVVGYLNENETGECYYRVAIAPGKTTYIAFTYPSGTPPQGGGTDTGPWVLNPFEAPGNTQYHSGNGTDPEPTDPTPTNPGTQPPAGNNDLTVIAGDNGGGLMQPNDGTPAIDSTSSSGTFDRTYTSTGDRMYPSGMVQPYLPNPSILGLPYPQGGDGTKQNTGGRGYFNFRFHWRADTDWGIGYLAIQKLQRVGTSSSKTPTGPVIVLLDAKADTEAERISGVGQRRLGNIYSGSLPANKSIDSEGSVKGENRSFNQWQRNWLGLRDSATGWQKNVRADGTLDPYQPVYRSGKGYYPTASRDAAWNTDKKDDAAHREYSAHRAVNNPGRLYTTGVTPNGLYAALGTGFEAGEYRVYLYKGYDSLYDNSKTSGHNDPVRQKKMYRYYDDSFDIAIYPGVVTTALYRDDLETSDIEGAFAYTPIPQAAFGKLVVLNNHTDTVNAILLDKPGYKSTVNTSTKLEVHRYLAALSTTPTSMGSITSSFLNNSWSSMSPLQKSQMHTFILPPGGYRIAVRSTKSTSTWYGESPNDWLPVVVAEGETAYVTFSGTKLSR